MTNFINEIIDSSIITKIFILFILISAYSFIEDLINEYNDTKKWSDVLNIWNMVYLMPTLIFSLGLYMSLNTNENAAFILVFSFVVAIPFVIFDMLGSSNIDYDPNS